MSTHNDNYEPTSRVNYEHTTPNPYLHVTYLPPPPPEYYMHQRTGKAWKVAIPVVLLLLGAEWSERFTLPLVFSTTYPKQTERWPRHALKFLARQMEYAPQRALSSLLSSRARRSLPLQLPSTPRERRRPATGRLRRGSRCR